MAGAETWPLDESGLWVEQRTRAGAFAGRPALFLDRDGTLIEDPGFLADPDGVVMVPGAVPLVLEANRRGWATVVLTNQSGIGRRFYGWSEFAAVQTRMLEELDAEGARLDMVLACPFYPGVEAPYGHPDHPDRKPNPGMLQRAAEAFDLDLTASIIFGDRASDLEAGRNAGLSRGVLLRWPEMAREAERSRELAVAAFEVIERDSLAGAAALL